MSEQENGGHEWIKVSVGGVCEGTGAGYSPMKLIGGDRVELRDDAMEIREIPGHGRLVSVDVADVAPDGWVLYRVGPGRPYSRALYDEVLRRRDETDVGHQLDVVPQRIIALADTLLRKGSIGQGQRSTVPPVVRGGAPPKFASVAEFRNRVIDAIEAERHVGKPTPTKDEVARLLGISESSMHNWCAKAKGWPALKQEGERRS